MRKGKFCNNKSHKKASKEFKYTLSNKNPLKEIFLYVCDIILQLHNIHRGNYISIYVENSIRFKIKLKITDAHGISANTYGSGAIVALCHSSFMIWVHAYGMKRSNVNAAPSIYQEVTFYL